MHVFNSNSKLVFKIRNVRTMFTVKNHLMQIDHLSARWFFSKWYQFLHIFRFDLFVAHTFPVLYLDEAHEVATSKIRQQFDARLLVHSQQMVGLRCQVCQCHVFLEIFKFTTML